MPAKFMFVVYAPRSGAGKDTIADMILEALPGTVKYKFSRPMKTCVERWLKLQPGDLDTPLIDAHVINPLTLHVEDFTYRDLMIRAYHAWDDIYPGGYLSVNEIYERAVKVPASAVFVDVRKQAEIDVLRKLTQNGYIGVLIDIKGDRGKALTSDGNITIPQDIFTRIATIRNTKTTPKSALLSDVHYLVYSLRERYKNV